MTQEIWFRNDIKHVLMGVDLANSHLAGRLEDHESQVFREGFQAALAAAAVSFGLQPFDVRCARIQGIAPYAERVQVVDEYAILPASGSLR